jgi:hypothetical protein
VAKLARRRTPIRKSVLRMEMLLFPTRILKVPDRVLGGGDPGDVLSKEEPHDQPESVSTAQLLIDPFQENP